MLAKLKTWLHTIIFLWMFTAVWFTITPNWTQLKCPSTGEWIEIPVQPVSGTALGGTRPLTHAHHGYLSDEARSKGLPAIYLHVNDILEKAQLLHTAGQWLAGLELGQGCGHKWVSREFGGDGSVPSEPDRNHNSETCTPQKGGFYCMKFLSV